MDRVCPYRGAASKVAIPGLDPGTLRLSALRATPLRQIAVLIIRARYLYIATGSYKNRDYQRLSLACLAL
jgi:hypothetical protein